jgi:hypothetical protein
MGWILFSEDHDNHKKIQGQRKFFGPGVDSFMVLTFAGGRGLNQKGE